MLYLENPVEISLWAIHETAPYLEMFVEMERLRLHRRDQ